jgi:hypothetical protein
MLNWFRTNSLVDDDEMLPREDGKTSGPDLFASPLLTTGESPMQKIYCLGGE